MEQKKELINKIKEILSLYPKKNKIPEEAIELYDETKKFFKTLLDNVNSMEDIFINKSSINQILSYLDICFKYINYISFNSLRNNEYDILILLKRIKKQFSEIIKSYNEMYLFPLSFNKYFANHNKEVKTSYNILFENIKKIKVNTDSKIKVIKESLDTEINEIDETLSNKKEELNNIIENCKKELDAEKDKIKEQGKDILDVIGKVTGGKYSEFYKQYADEENNSANKYRIYVKSISAISFLGFVFLAYFLLHSIPDNINFETIIYKFGILLPIIAVIFFVIKYFSKQSADHRDKSHKYRDIALKALTIDSYIAPLPKELQNVVKVYVAGELFSNNNISKNKESNDEFKKILISRIDQFLDRNSKEFLEKLKAEFDNKNNEKN